MVGNGYLRLVLRCSSAGHRPEGREGEGHRQACGKGPWQSESQDSEMGGCLGDLKGVKKNYREYGLSRTEERAVRDREMHLGARYYMHPWKVVFFFFHSILSEIGSHGGGYFSFFCTMQLSSHKSTEEREAKYYKSITQHNNKKTN